jgi:putative thioredoxin
MNDAHAHVVSASEEDFATVALEESRSRPVLVDFWAPWCGPCRTLTPILEAEIAAAGGAVRLVKVNTDENPGLAQAYGIRGIPAVKAFVDGKVVDEFTGALPRAQVRAFLKGLVRGPERELVLAAVALAEAGRFDEADKKADEALALDDKLALAWVVRAQAAAARGEVDEAERTLGRADGDPEAAPAVGGLRSHLIFQRIAMGSDDEAALRARLGEGTDPDAAVSLAAHEVLAGKRGEAFERLLPLLSKKMHKERAHKLILALLPLADEEAGRDMRKRLSRALF